MSLPTRCEIIALAWEKRWVAGRCHEHIEVPWDGKGWLRALAELWKRSAAWRGRWVVLQYTALMWSRRGFPLAVPAIVWMMKMRGCRTAVVFHDVYAVPGSRWIDRVRVEFQVLVMRHACRHADRAIFPVPVEQVPWLSSAPANASFIPVGANIPSRDDLEQWAHCRNGVRPRRSRCLAYPVAAGRGTRKSRISDE